MIDATFLASSIFKRYIEECIDSNEAGGFLLGRVRGEHLEIIEATEPSFWDRRFSFFFERMPYFHHKLAMKDGRRAKGWRAMLESGIPIRKIIQRRH
jgi:hypothetical protein